MARRGAFGMAASLTALLTACGGLGTLPAAHSPAPATPAVQPTPVVSASPSPVPSPSAAPAVVTAGLPAFVAVSVATGWHSPSSPRPVDTPALANPARIREWLAKMSEGDQEDLVGRADTQILLGERVDVLSVSGAWAGVVVPDQPTPLDSRGYPVYVPLAQLTAVPAPESSQEATVTSPTAWLLAPDGGHMVEISYGTRLPVIAAGSPLTVVGLPDRGTAAIADADITVEARGAPALPRDGGAIVADARRFLGLPYLWAGTSGFGFDCSGLAHSVYAAHGILIPRDADAQSAAGTPVARSSLQPGDLVFFARNGYVHHVALYAGGGQILDSPSPGGAVEVVPLAAWYATEYWGGRRYLG